MNYILKKCLIVSVPILYLYYFTINKHNPFIMNERTIIAFIFEINILWFC
jgi:hypothetical protein